MEAFIVYSEATRWIYSFEIIKQKLKYAAVNDRNKVKSLQTPLNTPYMYVIHPGVKVAIGVIYIAMSNHG
jgi:hypothetical protein